MYIGFFSGYAHRIYYDDDVKVPMVLAAVGDILYNLAVYGLQFLLRGRLGLHTYLFRIILPEACLYRIFDPDRISGFSVLSIIDLWILQGKKVSQCGY